MVRIQAHNYRWNPQHKAEEQQDLTCQSKVFRMKMLQGVTQKKALDILQRNYKYKSAHTADRSAKLLKGL